MFADEEQLQRQKNTLGIRRTVVRITIAVETCNNCFQMPVGSLAFHLPPVILQNSAESREKFKTILTVNFVHIAVQLPN